MGKEEMWEAVWPEKQAVSGSLGILGSDVKYWRAEVSGAVVHQKTHAIVQDEKKSEILHDLDGS